MASDGFDLVLKALSRRKRNRETDPSNEEFLDVLKDADADDDKRLIKDINDLFDDLWDFVDDIADRKGRQLSDRDIEDMVIDSVIGIRSALLADNDDDLFDDLSKKEQDRCDKYLTYLEDLDEFLDGNKRSSRSDRDRDKGRDRNGRRLKRRDRDDDDRRDSRRERSERTERRRRPERMDDGIVKREQPKKLVEEEPPQPVKEEKPDFPFLSVEATRHRRPTVMSQNNTGTVHLVPQTSSFDDAYYTVGIDPLPWRKLYRASSQIPMFRMVEVKTCIGTAYHQTNSKNWQIECEEIAKRGDGRYEEIKGKMSKSDIKHLEHLFFKDTIGRSSQGSDIKKSENILDVLLSNVREVIGDTLKSFMVGNRLGSLHYHFSDPITSDNRDQSIDLVDYFVEHAPEGVDVDDVLISGVMVETLPQTFPSNPANDAMVESLRNKRTHTTLARQFLEMQDCMPISMWSQVNRMATDQFNEMVNICLGLHISIDSYALDIADAIDYINNEWGDRVVEWLNSLANRMLQTTFNFVLANVKVGDEGQDEQAWALQVSSMVVRLPCYAADIDLAVGDTLGVAAISSTDNREFFEGIQLIMERSSDCRYIKMMTIDGDVAYLYNTPVSNAVLISRHRNGELGQIMQMARN